MCSGIEGKLGTYVEASSPPWDRNVPIVDPVMM
jgi:hypothetical protein